MATLGLDDDEFKIMEQTLSRLAQLSSSIQSLKMDIIKSSPLPNPLEQLETRYFRLWQANMNRSSSLQASAQILQRNLQTVLDSLTENSNLFSRIALHPSTNYPGRTQEAILTQLLRKKLEPDVEELVAKGRETAKLATSKGVEELQQIWDHLRAWTHERIAIYVREEAGQVYTAEERAQGVEGVRTGLKRDVEEDEGAEDEDDEDEEDEDGEEGKDEESESDSKAADEASKIARGPEPETLLWFASRGDFDVPRNVEYERKGGQVFKGLEGVNIPGDAMQL